MIKTNRVTLKNKKTGKKVSLIRKNSGRPKPKFPKYA